MKKAKLKEVNMEETHTIRLDGFVDYNIVFKNLDEKTTYKELKKAEQDLIKRIEAMIYKEQK